MSSFLNEVQIVTQSHSSIDSAPHRGPLTVRALVEKYLKNARHNVAVATFDSYRQSLSQFSRDKGDRHIEGLRPLDLTCWIDSQPWSTNNTRQGVVIRIRAPFIWGVKQGLLDRNPFSGVRYRVSKKSTKIPTANEEHSILLSKAPSDFGVVLDTFWETGMRASELCKLRMNEINDDYLDLPEHKTVMRTFASREIPLSERAKVAIKKAIARQLLWKARGHLPEDYDRLFFSRAGTPLHVQNNLDQRFRNLRKRCKLRESLTIHCYRHSLATRLIKAHVPDRIVAEILGWSDIRMCQRYGHPTRGDLSEALETAQKIVIL